MRTRSFVVGALATIGALGLIASCGDDPKSNLPTGPSLGLPASVTIDGPENVAPGQSVQFAAQIRLSDGSSKAVATEQRQQRPMEQVRTRPFSRCNVACVAADWIAAGRGGRGHHPYSESSPFPGQTFRRSNQEITHRASRHVSARGDSQ